MTNLIELNNEQKYYDNYFKYFFNKLDFDNLKVLSNFYRINLKEIHTFNSNNHKFKRNLNINTKKEDNSSTNEINIHSIYKNNSYKTNLKLNQIQKSSIIKEKKIINESLKKNTQIKNNLKNPSKTQMKYLKILRGVLDNELYKEKNEKNIYEKFKTINQQRNNYNINKENKKINIIDSILIGKSVFNNCILRNKLIYDIKPLNKSEQKGKCYFSLEDKPNKALTDRNSINSIDGITLNEYSSINNDKRNNTINNNSLNINIKKPNTKKTKKMSEIPLNILLSKEFNENLKGPNLKTFYGSGADDLMRGEKIKFIKTCYPVKFIKPLLTQKGYILKSSYISNLSKDKINQYKTKKKILRNIVLNDFKRKRSNQIKNVKDELKNIKKNIFNAFKWCNEQKDKLFKNAME